ncbi:MAG: lamin tail domain-containing protein [Methanobacteriota archaeon]
MCPKMLSLSVVSLILLSFSTHALGWSNGGYSTTIAAPSLGSHDRVATVAMNFLPSTESAFLLSNLGMYEYGTELPDNSQAVLGDGFGDASMHHVYFSADGTCTDNSSAYRAKQMYQAALASLKSGDTANAAKWSGAMTHYIADLAVFGHVMGADTPWGAENHHSDYEDYVEAHWYGFQGMMSFDGVLTPRTAYDAAITLAHDTTFDDSAAGKTCVWMDANATAVLPVNPPPVNPPPSGQGHLLVNEVEPNPAGDDVGVEWVEIYNPMTAAVDLTGWSLSTSHGDVVTVQLSGSIAAAGYKIVTRTSQWLDNEDESVTLKSGTAVIDATPVITDKDSPGDARTWSRVPNGVDTDSTTDWKFVQGTPGSANPSTRAYDWTDSVFKARATQSLNLAVNLLADVLHTLYFEAGGASPLPDDAPVDDSAPVDQVVDDALADASLPGNEADETGGADIPPDSEGGSDGGVDLTIPLAVLAGVASTLLLLMAAWGKRRRSR